jgi:hypothetical protein
MNDAQRSLSDLGIRPRPDYSLTPTYQLRHTGDLDELRRAAHDEGPGGVNYARYMSALQNGHDEGLPSIEAFNGAVPQSAEDQLNNAAGVAQRNTQRWVNYDPMLDLLKGPDGRPLSEHPVEVAHQTAAMLAADGYRAGAVLLQQAIDRSMSSSTSISIQDPGPDLSYDVAADSLSSLSTEDVYTTWRQEQATKSLTIQPAGADAALFAGTSEDGLSYSVADDWSRDGDE